LLDRLSARLVVDALMTLLNPLGGILFGLGNGFSLLSLSLDSVIFLGLNLFKPFFPVLSFPSSTKLVVLALAPTFLGNAKLAAVVAALFPISPLRYMGLSLSAVGASS
jgi:hypothetical protein